MKVINLRNDVRLIFERHFEKYLTSDMQVYDIGCGEKPFASALNGKVKSYIGVDVEDGFYSASSIDLVGTAYDVPIGNGAADAVISSQVIEHLEYPEKAITEAARITKKGGFFFLAFPFLYPLHAEPYDYTRITEFKIKKVLKEAGFEILEFQRVGGFWYLVGLFLGIYLQPIDRGMLKKTKISTFILWFVRCLFKSLHNLEGFILRILNKNPDFLRKRWTNNYILVTQKL